MEKTLKTFPEGRRCKYVGCEKILSIYNHQTYCRIHLKQVPSEEKKKTYRHACKLRSR